MSVIFIKTYSIISERWHTLVGNSCLIWFFSFFFFIYSFYSLQARKPGGADMFICYAGVQLREAVASKSDWLVFDFKDLINTLEWFETLRVTSIGFVLLFHYCFVTSIFAEASVSLLQVLNVKKRREKQENDS